MDVEVPETFAPEAAVITVALDGVLMFQVDATGETFAPADHAGRAAVALALAGAQATLASLPRPKEAPTLGTYIANAIHRLDAIGTSAARDAIGALREAIEVHTEAFAAATDAMEAADQSTAH